jgi:hypothetical protein
MEGYLREVPTKERENGGISAKVEEGEEMVKIV